MRTALQANKMVIIPASAAKAEGLTFTVIQITWTTHVGGLTTTTSKENQIQSETMKVVFPITPTRTIMTLTNRPPLRLYRGKRVDNSDLLEAIDRANHRLLEVSGLVNSISDQTAQASAPNFLNSRRPTRATTHERLGTSLTIMATPEGRTVQFKATSANGSFPRGFSNAADQVLRPTQSLFREMDLSS